MKKSVSVKELNGNVVVSSRDVARDFNKRHYEVMSAIEGRSCSCNGKGCEKCSGRGYYQIGILEMNIKSHSSNELEKMFIESSYKDGQNREQRKYIINRDGFSLLAMGFTGSEALEWKLKYIEAFNYMVNLLREKQTAEWKTARAIGKQTRRDETDVIMEKLIPLAEKQGSKNSHMLYMVYSKLVNRVLGIKADQRDNLSIEHIVNIGFFERMIENIISDEVDKGTHYKEIFQKCKVNCELIAKLSYLPKLEELTA